MEDNYLDIEVAPSSKRVVVHEPVYQWDYGLKLRLTGLNLDTIPTAHFAHDDQKTKATCVPCTLEDDTLVIPVPRNMLDQRRNVFCYLYYEDAEFGRTELTISIPIIARAEPQETEYEEEEVSQFDSLLAQLNGKLSELNELIAQANGLQEALGKKYEKPEDGIPETDLAEGVIPTELKNPNKLIINNTEYDGSSEVEMTIKTEVDQEVIEGSENAVSGGAVYAELDEVKKSVGDLGDTLDDISNLNGNLMETLKVIETEEASSTLMIEDINMTYGRLSIVGSVSNADMYDMYINGQKVVRATILTTNDSCGCISIQKIAGQTIMFVCPPAAEGFLTATVSCCYLNLDEPITSIEFVACGNSSINAGTKITVEGVAA